MSSDHIRTGLVAIMLAASSAAKSRRTCSAEGAGAESSIMLSLSIVDETGRRCAEPRPQFGGAGDVC